MQKTSNIFLQEFRSRPLAYGVQMVGIIVVLLNVWLSTKLFPMAQNIDSLIEKVEAAEVNISDLEKKSDMYTNLFSDFKATCVQIDEIDKRLERLDERLSKHLGI